MTPDPRIFTETTSHWSKVVHGVPLRSNLGASFANVLEHVRSEFNYKVKWPASMSKSCDLPKFPMGSKSRAPSPFKSGCIKSWGFDTKLKNVDLCSFMLIYEIPVYLQHRVTCIISAIDKILWVCLIQKPIFC